MYKGRASFIVDVVLRSVDETGFKTSVPFLAEGTPAYDNYFVGFIYGGTYI